MQITVAGPLAVRSSKTGGIITSAVKLRKLNRLVSRDSCVNYFDGELSDLDLEEGLIRFSFDAESGATKVQTNYRCEQALTDAQLELLKDATVGQWTDGIGEGDFDDFQGETGMTLDLYPLGSAVTVEQTEDPVGKPKAKRRRIFSAIAKGDIAGVEKAILAGEDLESRKEHYTPLLMAAHTGQVDIAELLLRHGANVHATDNLGHGGLMLSAVVRAEFVSDETAATLAEILIAAGANPNAIDHWGTHPLYMARHRGKEKLAAVLEAHGALLFGVEIRVQTADGKGAKREGSIMYKGASAARPIESTDDGLLQLTDLSPATFILTLYNGDVQDFELVLDDRGKIQPETVTVHDVE